MPRSIWNGTITLGLIAVPVKVSSAIEDRGVHFHQVHATDGARIKQRRVCSKEGKEVPYDEVAKGYEVSSGEYVLLSPEEIAAAGGDGAHAIALEEFVGAHEIDPDYFARTYYLAAGESGQDAYRLLHDALTKSERLGIGRWVFHNREYLVGVRAREDALVLHTMRFSDELVAPGDLDIESPSRPANRREIKMAGALVESLLAPFNPKSYTDTYAEKLRALIERKAKGEEIEIPPAGEPEPAPDLIEALEASLKGRGGASKRSRSSASSKSSRSRSSKSSGSRSSKSSGTRKAKR
jgi:DNA end-binding protein Ku